MYVFEERKSLRNITGPPVEGNDFYGREKELGYVWKLIENGNNIVLPSPRVVGKTSFALRLVGIAKEKEWKTIAINLEQFTKL